MKKRNEKTFNKKKNEIMEISYDCYAEHGLAGTGIKTVMMRVECLRQVYIHISIVLMI